MLYFNDITFYTNFFVSILLSLDTFFSENHIYFFFTYIFETIINNFFFFSCILIHSFCELFQFWFYFFNQNKDIPPIAQDIPILDDAFFSQLTSKDPEDPEDPEKAAARRRLQRQCGEFYESSRKLILKTQQTLLEQQKQALEQQYHELYVVYNETCQQQNLELAEDFEALRLLEIEHKSFRKKFYVILGCTCIVGGLAMAHWIMTYLQGLGIV